MHKRTISLRRTLAFFRLLDQKTWNLLRQYYLRAVLLCLLIAAPLVFWAFWYEPNSLRVEAVTLEIPDWPANLNNFKIVALSDLHVGSPHITLDKVRRIVELSNEQQPDLTVLLGDYVIQGVIGGKFAAPEDFAPLLQTLQAKNGVYAVLGNHDWMLDGTRVTQALEQANVKVLTNATVKIETAQSPFWLVGVGDFFSHHQDVEKSFATVNAPAPILAITHTPDIFLKFPPQVTLTLAGHTHGGQVNLPLLGRRVVPSNYGDKYAVGYVEENGKRIYVTSGIGTSILPARFRVPPEIVVLTLRHKS